MRLLLAGILALLPLTAKAELNDNLRTMEVDPNSVVDPVSMEPPNDLANVIKEWGPYGNPYSPASATNFEAFAAPLPYDQGGNDRGGLSTHLYDPDSFSNRHDAGHPYILDSPTNAYGRGWRLEKR